MTQWFSAFWASRIRKMKAFQVLLISVAATGNVLCDFIGSPLANGPPGGTPFPFFATTNNGPSMRYQQVYGAADFEAQGHGPQYLITGISFTGGTVFGPSDITVSNIQMRFSTTQKRPDGLST